MKSYRSLIPIYARVHRRENRMTLVCIVLAVFLVSCIFGMADMEIRSQRIQAEQSDGAWHVLFQNLSGEQSALIAARPNVEAASRYGVLNYRLDEDYLLCGEKAVVCGVDADFVALMPAAAVSEGAFPAHGQIVATESAKERLDLSVGASAAFGLPDGSERSVTVSGFDVTTAMLSERDALGILMNMEDFNALSDALALPRQDGTLYVRFASAAGIPAAVEEIQAALDIPDGDVQENVKLLGTLGQSRDSYLVSLYTAAAVLAVLVVCAGALMICSSLNANIARRTSFFGLMRCLGATPGQVRGYVRLEAFSWCAFAIPAGVLLSVVTTWLLCWMLRSLSPGYFAKMPTFGVSGVAIAMGTVVGLLTVLIAAIRPARRASRVSPLVALLEDAGSIPQAKRGAPLCALPVETALGIRHATVNRKNLVLMAGSFALSIVLFLSFAPAIRFMRRAIRPLAPYTPDVSIISADNTCSVPRETAAALEANPAVKRVYGRMFAYDVPVTVDGNDVRVHLISYEAHQFRWAKSGLIEGALSAAEAGDGVLTVYYEGNPIAVGDSLSGDFGAGAADVPVCGMLSDSPFVHEDGVETVICSEALFRRLTGQNGYTVLDVQLGGKATEEDVADIRALCGDNAAFSDRRLSNREIRGAFYSMSLFLYGFLVIIALIAAFNIINSMAMSVSARIRQYGAMRAIGMSDVQMRRMVLCEAVTYAVSGIVIGCAAGVPANKALFQLMVTSHWGDPWTFPLAAMLVIVTVVAVSALLSVREPERRIRAMTIVETIRAD